MSAPRLHQLYPSICRAASSVEIGPLRTSVRQRPAPKSTARLYTTTPRRREEARAQRYGTANAPPPHLLEETAIAGRKVKDERPARTGDKEGMPEKEIAAAANVEGKASPERFEIGSATDSTIAEETPTRDDAVRGVTTSADQVADLERPQPNPKDTVLAMPAPSEVADEDKPPHLQAPPYVHHFDTWTLVRSLQTGGFSQDQSTTIMKAVRTILADNMDLARRGLVSKSNVENETYLFRAACSELKTEVQNNRKGEADKERTQRAQLQHEVDILNQKTTQETANLKDELKGMFDDRKMAVRMEQRNMERKIQELNYKITVVLNSDARTEVEGVRWVLTRRAASALAVGVIMILATLNYSRYMTATQAKERKKFEEEMRLGSSTGIHPPEGGDGGSVALNPGDAPSPEALLAREGTPLS